LDLLQGDVSSAARSVLTLNPIAAITAAPDNDNPRIDPSPGFRQPLSPKAGSVLCFEVCL
jgi:hypothetical protein